MARGRKHTPTEGQLDIFDALMDIESEDGLWEERSGPRRSRCSSANGSRPGQ